MANSVDTATTQDNGTGAQGNLDARSEALAANSNTTSGTGGGYSPVRHEDHAAGSIGSPTSKIKTASGNDGLITIALKPAMTINGWGAPGRKAVTRLRAPGYLPITGSGSASESRDASSGSGKETFTGTGSPAEGHDASAGSGKETFTGSGSATEHQDSASGTSALTISGAGAPVEGRDTAAGTCAALLPVHSEAARP